jgi:hypothetical protein
MYSGAGSRVAFIQVVSCIPLHSLQMGVFAVLVLSRIAAAVAEHGGSLTDVEVREDGLYAVHALPAGSRIATSPYKLAVTPQTCLNDPSSDFSKLDPAVVSAGPGHTGRHFSLRVCWRRMATWWIVIRRSCRLFT